MKKRFLNELKKELKNQFSIHEKNTLITLSFNKSPLLTNTGGYVLELLNVHNRYGIDFWLDEFTNTTSPRLCLTLWGESINFIESVVKLIGEEYYLRGHESKVAINKGIEKLKTPLPQKYFGHYIIEPYKTKYLSLYFNVNIDSRTLRRRLFVSQIIDELQFLTDVLYELNSSQSILGRDYPGIENRIIVRQHKFRERDSLTAQRAKERDNYVCQICYDRLLDKYGEIAHAVAEAHHIVPLSRINGVVKTKVNDLLTVCPNCHRVLHQMKGERGDIAKLRKIIAKKQRPLLAPLR